jgi:hypothetical protein
VNVLAGNFVGEKMGFGFTIFGEIGEKADGEK